MLRRERSSRGALPAALGCVLSVVCGCTALPRFAPLGARVDASSAREICERIVSREAPLQSLRALTEATFSYDGESASFRYALASREPDQLRVDMLPLEGAFTLGILVSAGGHVTLLNAQERTYLEGGNETSLLERFFGVPGISRSLIVGMASGRVPPLPCEEVEVTSGADGVTLVDKRAHLAWTVASEDDPRMVRISVLNDDGSRMKLDAARNQGSTFISIYDPVHANGELVVTKFTPNPSLPESLFSVRIPESYSRLE